MERGLAMRTIIIFYLVGIFLLLGVVVYRKMTPGRRRRASERADAVPIPRVQNVTESMDELKKLQWRTEMTAQMPDLQGSSGVGSYDYLDK